MNKRTKLRTISSSLVWVPLLLLSQACEQEASVREIGPSRPEAIPEKGHGGNATSPERFGYKAVPDRAPDSKGEPRPVYELPAGWTKLPPRQFRTVNLQVAGNEDATCHLTLLGGDGGGLLANVNRWRNQIGLAAFGSADIAKLPTHKFFTSEAVLLDLTGDYSGMGGGQGKENWGLMGLLLVAPQASLFLKMQGPADLLQKEKQHFLDLAASFKWERGGAPRAGNAATGAGSPGATAGGGAKKTLGHDQPAGWTPKAGSQYRVINFDVGSGGQTECYVSQSGGGLLPNLNRWRGQMGKKPMSSTELNQLPALKVLGVETPLLEIEGPFQGMKGPKIEKAGMLATYVETQGTSYAIKLTGPIAEVTAAKKDFVNFVQSLRLR